MHMTDDELRDALDGLFAYDTGSVDSGIHDEGLRAACIAELKGRLEVGKSEPGAGGAFLAWEARFLRDMHLSDESIQQGYCIADFLEFVQWLDECMNYRVG
jgi:hypothetical protein